MMGKTLAAKNENHRDTHHVIDIAVTEKRGFESSNAPACPPSGIGLIARVLLAIS